jgi:hypothetical protein
MEVRLLPCHVRIPPPCMPPRQGSRVPPPRPGSVVPPECVRLIPPRVQRRIDMSRAVRARIDRCKYLRAVGGKEAEQELQQIEAEEVLEHQKFIRQEFKPLYLCDQSAVQILVKAVTEGPSPLGAWVQQQLKAGYLWSCTAVDAVPGWKLYTFESELSDNGRPFLVQRVFKKLCVEVSDDAMSEYPELYDTVATYARVHSFVEDGPINAFKRLVTANRAFESLVLASEERRSAALEEFFGISYVLRRGTSGPVVLFVDDVHQEKPEGLPFQEGDIASAEAKRVQHLSWPAQAAAPC